MDLVPHQSKSKETCTSFLTNEREKIALSLVCTCNLLFATCISDFAHLPFWSDNMGYIHSVASNLSLLFDLHPSFLQGLSYLQTPLLMVELFWWLPLATFLLRPVSPILSLLDSLLVGKGFLTENILNEMEFCTFYYVQNFGFLCYFHPGSYKILQSSC